MVIIDAIGLLTRAEYREYRAYIPDVPKVCWLKSTENNDVKAPVVYPVAAADKRTVADIKLLSGIRPSMIIEGQFEDYAQGDMIKIFDLTWTFLVVNSTKNKATVLCNSVIAMRRYDDIRSDWEFSELKRWLQDWCRYMCLGVEDVAYGLDIAGIALLSEAQYEEYKHLVKPLKEEWWLQDIGDGFKYGPKPFDLVKSVDCKGNVRKFGSIVRNEFAVRPTMCIELESGVVGQGDLIQFLNQDWIILHTYAGVNKLQLFVLCNNPVMCNQFDVKCNDFFTSELYEKLTDWCQTECEKFESINYKEE